jgi:hypothetical protein
MVPPLAQDIEKDLTVNKHQQGVRKSNLSDKFRRIWRRMAAAGSKDVTGPPTEAEQTRLGINLSP